MSSVVVTFAGCAPQEFPAPNKPPVIAILVDPQLSGSIAPAQTQFVADLEAEGWEVVVTSATFASPIDVRTYLAGLLQSTGLRLHGAFLIGDIPYAYQFVALTFSNPAIPPLEEEVISYQFYADLNGTFGQSAGYQSPGGKAFSYDTHTGRVDWEIWIGVLPMYGPDYGASAQAINAYLARNHEYRVAGPTLPRAFLQVDEHRSAATLVDHWQVLSDLTSGTYAWTPWSDDPSAQIYFDSPSAGLSVADGYAALAQGLADFFVGSAHGSRLTHGQLTLTWLSQNPVLTTFFWSDGCATGNLDSTPNFLTSVLYDEDGKVLFAKGTTNDSGGMGTNSDGFFGHNIATRAYSGIGSAILRHVNVPLIPPWSNSREFHYATAVFLGDPTLRVPR